MELTLDKKQFKKGKRLGQGYGSGKGGHTSGRGQKGQKTRGKINIIFEGVKVKKSFIKRLPLRRGRGKFSAKKKPVIVKLSLLNLLPDNSKVNIDTLVKANIVDKADAIKYGVKILGDGKLDRKLTVELPISKSALREVNAVKGKKATGEAAKKE